MLEQSPRAPGSVDVLTSSLRLREVEDKLLCIFEKKIK